MKHQILFEDGSTRGQTAAEKEEKCARAGARAIASQGGLAILLLLRTGHDGKPRTM